MPWYELTICAEPPGPVRLVGGATLHTPHGLDVVRRRRDVIVPGVADVTPSCRPELVAALRAAHGRGRPDRVDLLRRVRPGRGGPA